MIGLVAANTTELDPETNLPLVECVELLPSGDMIPFGSLPMYQTLGVTSIPYPPDEGDDPGYAEMAVANLGGEWIILGGRDSRTASVVGGAEGGDTIVHSTGPNQAAQLQLKERKRQAALVTVTESGDTMIQMLDGKAVKYSLLVDGNVVEVSSAQGIALAEKGGAGIHLKDGVVSITGTIILGGRIPNLPVLMGTAGPAGVGAPGVFIGS